MESTNLVRRRKELINIIKEADVAYFVNDHPTMSDNEYDKLVAELKGIEHETGIVFSDSPSKRVGGNVKEELKSVTHTKPMLSAKKTKCIGDVLEFAANKDVVVSWKLDGLTIVLRYENGELKQAITRGKDGLIGEDVTHTVRHFRNVPLKVPCKDIFEVRGEGVCSWSDFEIIKKNEGPTHPRNVAAGTVRTLTADEGKLSHLDFVAFELIDSNKDWNSKLEQLEFLENNKFSVVEHSFVGFGSDDIESEIGKYNPDTYFYPVDGVVIEYEDLKYGKSLGATAHHENRLIALKWEDAEYETIFRGVELATGRTGTVEINAIFDPVDIGGMMVRRANVHGLSGFEKLKLGVGDTIKVYKANMIIPQVSENLTKSGTFKLSEFCPCCGAKLEIKISNTGVRSLYCPNEDCLARNAQKIARFCDKKAMNIEGLNAANISAFMEQGFIKRIKDIYHLAAQTKQLLNATGLGIGNFDWLFEKIESSRSTNLARFLLGIGIQGMGPESAKKLDEYFGKSFKRFEEAIKNEYEFNQIEGISVSLNNKIYDWYYSEKEQAIWMPLIDELKFRGDTASTKRKNLSGDNVLENRNIAVVGIQDASELDAVKNALSKLGFSVDSTVTSDTEFMLVSLKG